LKSGGGERNFDMRKTVAELRQLIEEAKVNEKVKVFREKMVEINKFGVLDCAIVFELASSPEFIAVILDTGASGKMSDGVGLRCAIAQTLKELSVAWKFMKVKLQEVMNLTFAKVVPLLRKGGKEAEDLLRSLSVGIFPNKGHEKALQNLLRQIGFKLQAGDAKARGKDVGCVAGFTKC
jgi:hypothetical protein